MLGTSLRGVISQRLMPKIEGQGRVPAVEVMLGTEGIRERLVDPDKMDELVRADR